MGTLRSFEDIRAWQLARQLHGRIQAVTARVPFNQNGELREQMRRASISISPNIAEGFERSGTREFIGFLSIAKASADELRSQLYLAGDTGLIGARECRELCDMAFLVGKMIWRPMEYLRSCELKGIKFKSGQ